jgi:hypothetical protein
VFTLCNSHDKPIEFYLGAFDIRENRINASNTAFSIPIARYFEAKHFWYSCSEKWQGGLESSRMLNSDLTPMDADTKKLYKKERTQPMGNILRAPDQLYVAINK